MSSCIFTNDNNSEILLIEHPLSQIFASRDRHEVLFRQMHTYLINAGIIKNNIITKTVYTPIEWEKMFNLYRGSGLGLAHGLNQIGAFRPKNKDEKLNNLYYVGASTVPGTGLPIVVIGSKLVTERINNEYPII